MNLRWIILSVIIIVCTLFKGFTQVVTTDPEFPTAVDAVTVYFDATQGNQVLK